MKIEVPDFIILFFAGAGLVLCMVVGVQLLFRSKGIKLTNKLLGALLVLFALTTLNGLLATMGIYSQYKNLYFIPIVFNLSLGPLFYFFIRSKTSPSFSLEKKHLIHFILPTLQFAFYLSIGFRSVAFKSWMWSNVIAPYTQYIEEGLQIVMGLGYVIAAMILLKRVPQDYWKKPVYGWLKKFTQVLLVLLFIHSAYEIADWILWNLYQYNLYNTLWLAFPLKLADAGLSLWIGYNALIYQNQSFIVPTIESSNAVELKLKALFQYQKVYKDPELNLESLAKMVGQPKNSLSRHFSQQGESFRSYVNRYRVEEFISLVNSGKLAHLSMLGVAFESGFSSKASFNRIFREYKEVSPTEFFTK